MYENQSLIFVDLDKLKNNFLKIKLYILKRNIEKFKN